MSNYSEGNKNSPNGFYKNGEIYIDINAGTNGEGLILFTASHELVHFMRDFAPGEFDGFAKFLFDNYAKKGLSVRQAVHREMMMHQKLKYDEAYEEVVARLSESFLRDALLSEKSAELYNTDKNIWEKVRDGLKSIVDRIEKHFAGVSPESDLGKIGEKMARENREILDRFVAGVKTASENAAYIEKTTDEGGVRMMARDADVHFDYGMSQDSVDEYVDNAYTKSNTVDYKKYADVSSRLMNDLANDIDLSNYAHALRDNDIRHINNSHGENSGEKYPVTSEDLKAIPYITQYYDKVIAKENQHGNPGIVYVKVTPNNLIYYLEAVTDAYGNESLLVNKQMIKTGLDDLPKLSGLLEAIRKNQSETEFLADLKQIHKAYAQSEYQSNSDNYSVPQTGSESNTSDENNLGMKQERDNQTYTQEEVDEYIRKEREEADERINKLLRKYQGIRKANLTKRNKSKARHSIMKKTRELNKLLNRSAKEKTVKQGLRESAENLLKVSSMLFPESLTVEEMAAEGVGDATAQEQKALDRYNHQRRKPIVV